MLCKERVYGLLFLTLVLMNIAIFTPASSSAEQALFLDETDSFKHDPGDPVFFSVTDGYVVLRLVVNRDVNVENLSFVIQGVEYTMKPQLYLQDRVIWFGFIPHINKEFSYYFKAVLANGSILLIYSSRSKPEFYFRGVYEYPQVEWVRNRVGYQIFPDRFYNGDPSNDQYGLMYDSLLYDNTTSSMPVLSNWNDPPHDPHHCCHQYFGGDIRGIIMKLDYLKELGVGLIYLNPIFLCGSVHCYDTYDYYQVHPRLGTLEDILELLNEAHERDIKVIFDFVPGHVGLGFPGFQDIVVNGPNSRYWSWFTIYKWPFTPGDGRAYRCWWGFGSLPQLNTTVPEVKEYLFNAVLYWLELGFDGVRVDTPLDLINPREFFAELRALIKSRFPEAYVIGEIWQQRPEWVNRGPFDSLMNYALGLDILVEYARGRYGDNVAYVISSYYARYSVSSVGMGFNIIGSHDTDRVLTMLGGGRLFPEPSPPRESINRLKLLSTLQYTQPGMPVIFQGDERGTPGIKLYPWEEHRYPIQWDRVNIEVLEHYKQLGWIKNNLKPLHTSIIRVFETRNGVLAYTRGYYDEVLVVANNRLESVVFELPGDLRSTSWITLYSSTGMQLNMTSSEFIVPPLTAVILLNSKYKQEVLGNETSPVTTQTPSTETTIMETSTLSDTATTTYASPITESAETTATNTYTSTIYIKIALVVITLTAVLVVFKVISRKTHHQS